MNEENVGKVFNMTGGAGSGGIKLEMISITRAPNKTTYKSGELFDPTGMVVTAMYAYGLSSDVTGYQWSPTVMTDDISEVTITYTEGRTTKTVITPVTVLKALASLDITHQPTKTTYEYLESFDNTGLKVDAVYTDRSRTELRADQYSYSSDAFATLGEQAVTLSYTEDGITKTVDQTVTVEAIELQVPEQKNVPTYDGTAKTVEWNDDYDNTKMNVTGDTTGINAKTNYATTFTLIYGYKFPNGETSAEVNWAINRQPIEALPQQVNIPAYDGGVKNAEWDDNYDSNKMTVSGDQYGTAIGEYTVTFLPGSNYQWWDGSTGPKDAHWQIVDLKVSIPSQVNAPTYDGTDKTPTWENFDEENSTVSVSPATNAGEHDAVFTLTRGVWSDGTTAPKTIKWTIKRSPTAVLPQQAGSLTFDGNPQTPSWDDNYDTIKMSLNVVPKTNAGDTYGADFTPTSNYAWTDESVDTKTAIWSIGRATLSAVPEQTNVPTYDKSEKIPTWNGYSEAEGKMTMAGTTSETNAGTHNVVFTPTANYKWWDGTTEGKSASWVINKAQLTIPEGTVTEFTYDGDPHEPTVTGYASDTMERTGDTLKTGAGESYTVSYDLKDPDNYEWTDGTTETKTVNWKINKANSSVTVDKTEIALNMDKTTDTFTVTSKVGDGQLHASSSDENVATVSINGDVITVTGVSTGDVVISVWMSEGMNYKQSEAAFVDVEVAFVIRVTAASKDDSAFKAAMATGSPIELTIPEGTKVIGGNAFYNCSSLATVTIPSSVTSIGSNAFQNCSSLATVTIPSGVTSIGSNAFQNCSSLATVTIPSGVTSIDSNTFRSCLSLTSITIPSSVTTISQYVFQNCQSLTSVTFEGNPTTIQTCAFHNCISLTDLDIPSSVTTIGALAFYNVPSIHYAGTATGSPWGALSKVSYIYGVEWDWDNNNLSKGVRTDRAADFSDPNPAVKNGTGSSPFDNLYPWCGMVKETRTGGVMVKEPKFWFKWTKTGKKLKLQVADGPVEGFHVDPVNMDRGDGLGELDFSYIARYHCGTSDWKSTTNVAQKVNITRSAARTNIHGLGTYIWQMDFAQMWYVGMLYLVEFADWNGQAKIGYGCSASGSKENNGKTDAMQYHTGTTAANRTTYGYTQYRNIEGWWDNVYDWMDGCYYTSSGLNVILNPANFSDTTGGTLIGYMPSSGYPNELELCTISGYEWAVRPKTTGGSDSTYVPDNWNFYASNPCLCHGGYYSQDQIHGPFYVDYYSTLDSSGYIGCRLQERPPKTA